MQSTEEPTVVPKVTTVGLAKAEDNKAKEPQMEKVTKIPEILSPLRTTGLPNVQKTSATTPKRRMASVLDVGTVTCTWRFPFFSITKGSLS